MTTEKRERYMTLGVIACKNDGYLRPDHYEEFKTLINEILDEFDESNPFMIDQRDARPVKEQLVIVGPNGTKTTVIKDSRNV